MQIVIEIPNKIYKELTETATMVTEVYPSTIEKALTEGKPYKGRKTGKWIVEKDCEGKTRTLICPFCKWKSGRYAWEDYKYCPNCGAKMEVDNADSD